MRKIAILLFILTPLLLTSVIWFSRDDRVSVNENRTLQTRATVNGDIIGGGFQTWLEEYLSDQFPLRSRLKQAEVECRLALGAQEIGGAYIGQNGRLFPKITEADVDKAACLRYARRISTLAGETGLPTYVMYVPSSGTALRQSLPQGAPMYDSDALFEALTEALPDVSIIDIRQRMASDEANYYATDHHWTDKGVLLAYQAWCDCHEITPQELEWVSESDTFHGTLYSKVPSRRIPYDTLRAVRLNPLPTVIADQQEIPFYDYDALSGKEQYNFFQGGNHGVTVITNPQVTDSDSGKTLLILKDSFANSLVPCLIGHYRRIVMIDERYTFVDISQLAAEYEADEINLIRELISVP